MSDLYQVNKNQPAQKLFHSCKTISGLPCPEIKFKILFIPHSEVHSVIILYNHQLTPVGLTPENGHGEPHRKFIVA